MHNQQVASLEIYSGAGNCFQKNRTVDARKENPEHCALERAAVYLFIKRFQCPGPLV